MWENLKRETKGRKRRGREKKGKWREERSKEEKKRERGEESPYSECRWKRRTEEKAKDAEEGGRMGGKL